MNSSLPSRSGGQILVDQLRVHGVNTVFCVPGESYLAVLDALYDHRDAIRLIVCRQEGGAAFMAEAYAKATGMPGVCFVTRGPGATNASIGVHTAYQDSSPLILFVGQVGSDVVEREAFQEIDFRRMFGPMTKWVAQIDRADRIAELVSHAFHVAVAGRPGPVVLALPEDMLFSEAIAGDARPYQQVKASAAAADMERLRDLLNGASRPLVILGGGDWSMAACDDIRGFIEANNLPAACSFRRQDLLDNRHPNYCGELGIGINPLLAQRVRQSDLILAIGPRLGEMTTSGYSLIGIPHPTQRLVHVHADAEELGRIYRADLMINSGMAQFAHLAAALPAVDSSAWREWTHQARADYLKNLEPEPMAGNLDLALVLATLRRALPPNTIVTNGAGNYSGWVQRYWQYAGYRTQLAPTNGAMGYGVPAAIAAKLAYPERMVVSFSGDGCFLMNGQEIATAVQYRLKILFFVINNGMYGTIRMHQERDYPGRVYGSDLCNPDFAALARAYGLHGESVDRTEQFPAALERALRSDGAALIELKIDPEAITTRTTLSAIRERALQAPR
ncbi:MAG TPA: thiamine pyrophosphate-binding protein [Burkholderiales bacterium]|jgi:acetolactate synthase-1/2/3 large subunit|nr:thiamine pyrophosphate-binding protein [Burkholderiales bacterium]